jgi:hypothetical protein
VSLRGYTGWFLLAALATSSAVRADGTQSMADAMSRMMDAFSNRLLWNSMPGASAMDPSGWASPWPNPAQDWSAFGSPWSQQNAPWQAWGQWPPGAGYGYSQAAEIEGTWMANSGAVMVIRQGLVRLYLSEDLSQDFEYRLSGQDFMLRDARTGAISTYGYAQLGDHMMLRDPGGNVLLLQRVPSSSW